MQGVPRQEAVAVRDEAPLQAVKQVRFEAAPTGEPLLADCSPDGLCPADCSVRVAVQGEHSAASTTDARLGPEAPAGGSVPCLAPVGCSEPVDSAAADLCQADLYRDGYSERADLVVAARSAEPMKGDPVEPVVRLDGSVLRSALAGCYLADCSVRADSAAGDSFPDDSVPAGYPADCLVPVD